VTVSLVAAATTFAPSASADFPPCPGLGDALVSHSCFHARYGPYRTVTATSRADSASAPRIDGVHTHYEVILGSPIGESIVTYQVAGASRQGAWAFFHSDTVPLKVETSAGVRLAPVHSQSVPSCAFLPKVDVYELGGERVRLVFGPTNVTRTVVVAENVDDFVIENGRDADVDGYGSASDRVASFCVPPTGYVQNADDCNDSDARVHPAAPEVCDGVDQNCNGVADDVGLPCTSGVGACAREGVSVCDVAGATARCNAAAGPPLAETCDGKDTNCDGKDDLSTPALCTDPLSPRCIVDEGAVRCGCSADTDCGNDTSGRICDLDRRVCVQGCIDLIGRNGCPAGSRCSSKDPLVPGACVKTCAPECPRGSSCQQGTCVSDAPAPSDAGPIADASVVSPPEPEASPDADGGCSCDLVRAERSSFALSGFVVAVAGLALTRRRSRP
jgi:hypothetical protein